MGVSIEQWRATIGQWSGGRQGKCGTLQNCIAETSNHIGYKQIRFLVLVSLLVIGCVELNPGPDHETSATSQSDGADPEFSRRIGTDGSHGMKYEIKMAAFLFARALHKTEEFRLASNVDDLGALDDLVFRYRLKELNDWKTCFIQLKHKKDGGTIPLSDLINMSGKFSLLKYFESYCQIKSKASTHHNLEHCGPFDDFEFVLYTNGSMGNSWTLQGNASDPLNILNSGTNCGKYITFDEGSDTKIFTFFKELSEYNDFLVELDKLLAGGTSGSTNIDQKIKKFQGSVTNKAILGKVNSLKSKFSKDCVTCLIKELAKCDFNLYKKFLSKLKIFHSQSNEISLKELIEKELNVACKASPSVVKSIYTKFEGGISEWWKKVGNVPWLSKNSQLWKYVEKFVITEIKEISKHELQTFAACGIRFKQQHIQRLCDAIKHNTLLNIVSNSDIHYVHKLKTYQALNSLGCQVLNTSGYKNALFIGLKSLKIRHKEILKLWPSQWSAALVIDCDCDGNVADILLDILQDSVGCEQGLDISDENMVESLVAVLQKYEQKVIIISTGQHINLASHVQEKLANINVAYEDSCVVSDLDAESQRQILKGTVNFQGQDVPLNTVVGTDLPESIKCLVDSDVISRLLSNEHKLCVGRQLSDLPKYYVPRVLQHHVYLKDDILKLTHNKITFAVSGLQAGELKKCLPPGEKLCEFVYDERERSRFFKLISDFSVTDLSTDRGAMKTHEKLRQKLKPENDGYKNLWESTTENYFSDCIKNIYLTIADNFFTSGLSAELDNKEDYNKTEQKIKPEEVRYIILGNKNPEGIFRELKALLPNLHWILVEEGSYLWRDSNCNIDSIRRYIDDTNCKNYDIESVMEQSDRTMLLVAEPGMGKSTFLSQMEHKIKEKNTAVWVLRINLNEHTPLLKEIKSEEECFDKYKMFLWSVAYPPEQGSGELVKKIFLQALEQTGKMVIILDGFDEISPDYTEKVDNLIRAIRDKTASQILVSSRFSHRQNLEDIVKNLAITLQPFTRQKQIEFLEQYWNKDIEKYNEGNLGIFAEELLNICSKSFSDKDVEFTGIPLQTMMLGEAFVKEAVEYCSKEELNLPESLNLLDLFKKFWKKKCYIFFSGKYKMEISQPPVISVKKSFLKNHMIASLISLFSPSEENGLLGAIKGSDLQQAKDFLQSGTAEKFGIIREVVDGKPHFIHRCFAEYFAARWVTDNFIKCGDFISDTLFNSTYEVTRNIFDRMFAKDYKIHSAILNNDISTVEELMKNGTDINISDKGGRTALHLAASYNSPVIQTLLSGPDVDTNVPDAVLKWTPLRYADRTKSWMAMESLLQNGARPDDIVLTRPNSGAQEFEKQALRECASKGHRKLLEFLLNRGTEVNAVLEDPEDLQEKNTLLHISSYYCQVEVTSLLVERGADINISNAENNTALHVAAFSDSVEIINILLDKGMSVNVTNADEFTPLHFSAMNGKLEATKALVKLGAALNKVDKYGNTPLLIAAMYGKLQVFRYLIENGAEFDNILNDRGNTVLHHAANSGSEEIIKILLDKGMSVDMTNADDYTPLHFSAENGNLEATKALVERGAPLNNADKNGDTPLLSAASHGKLEVSRYLTENGAAINILNNRRDTVLHQAAFSGNVEIIKIFLDTGMSVDMTNADGHTPLHFSAGYGNLEATKALVERGAALNKVDKDGDTPLLQAAIHGKSEVFRYLTGIGADINIVNGRRNTVLHSTAIWGSEEIIKILLDKGMSVDMTNAEGHTPLHFSAAYGNLEATKALIERGAALNKADKYGDTPLIHAVCHDKSEVLRYLTEIGADTNILNDRRNTVLHYAAFSGDVEIIKILLDKGMSVDMTNADSATPLHFSAAYGNLEATKALVERGATLHKADHVGDTPLLIAAGHGKSEVFRYLIENGAEIGNLNDRENTVLHWAAIFGSEEIIKISLDKGMSVDMTNADDSTPLHFSAKNGNLEATKALAERGAALNKADKYGDTPLHIAAMHGKLEVFRYLTENGADINILDCWRNTVLHCAAISGSVEIIKILLDEGMSVDMKNLDGTTPLHFSAQNGNLEATKALVERGAALNNADNVGETPVLIAASCGKLEVFRYLIENGAEIDNLHGRRNTVLHYVAISGSVEIIKILLDKGMSVDMTNIDDSTPLHFSAKNGNLEATKDLVERGAALNKKDKSGNTPLLLAAGHGKLEVFLYLTENGADINLLDDRRNTALHYAAVSGDVEIIKILLDKGMSVDMTNADDYTPLHFSAENGNLEATKDFVERGAALNKTDKYGNTPLLTAASNGKLEVFRYLTENGGDINILNHTRNTALHYAAFSGSVEIIKIVLDEGMYVDMTNAKHYTPLHFSAGNGNLEATKALVERGAAFNKADKDGETPLLLAARRGKLEVFRYLTENGADINILDNMRNTVLHHAAVLGSVEIIKSLLDKGMSVDMTNADDSTPLHFSVANGNLEATKTLVERGAALNKADKYGNTPLLLAERHGNLEVFHYLTEIGADINSEQQRHCPPYCCYLL